MKKILFLLVAAVCSFAACDPIHEDISNNSKITADELKAKTTISVDQANGQNGNVITCQTSAAVNAVWNIGGKEFIGNFAKKKMKLGEHKVILTALCADGTVLKDSAIINCQVITDPLEKIYIYGDPKKEQEPAVLGPGDAAAGRFSDNEGKFFPYISDDVYFGKKTLIFEIIAAEEGKFIWGDDFGCTCRVMNGWWSTAYEDNYPLSVGLWELPITDQMAAECARGGEGRDLDILMTRGSVTIKSVYYEE
ncbi:MAG: hypothetical protein IKY01_10765 [Prevotella sp.]|nr:hypothetical protein [Prevotella sp.]